jgi:hypothetical protein
MAAIAAGFGRAHIARVVRGRNRRNPGPYIAPQAYIPSSTADLWKGARPRPCR